jgi:hypothetical protein
MMRTPAMGQENGNDKWNVIFFTQLDNTSASSRGKKAWSLTVHVF